MTVAGTAAPAAGWSAARPFVVVGAACTIAGGLVAAITRPTGWAEGSWLAAYLVLVGGVAQISLGVGQAVLFERLPSGRHRRAEVVAWNLGQLGVIGGTLAPAVPVTLAGGLATMVALVLFLVGGRTGGAPPRLAPYRHLYRGVAALVLASTPIGLALAWVRHA